MTGARLAEIQGLRLADVHLEGPIPHIRITPDERSLKTVKSVAGSRYTASLSTLFKRRLNVTHAAISCSENRVTRRLQVSAQRS